jgi:hypothetical protein
MYTMACAEGNPPLVSATAGTLAREKGIRAFIARNDASVIAYICACASIPCYVFQFSAKLNLYCKLNASNLGHRYFRQAWFI